MNRIVFLLFFLLFTQQSFALQNAQREAMDQQSSVKTQPKSSISDTINANDILPIAENPKIHPKYIENAIEHANIDGWGGSFILTINPKLGLPDKFIHLLRTEISLDENLFAKSNVQIEIRSVYKDRTAALKMIQKLSLSDNSRIYILLSNEFLC